jgi:hypothetical protein
MISFTIHSCIVEVDLVPAQEGDHKGRPYSNGRWFAFGDDGWLPINLVAGDTVPGHDVVIGTH